jgi:DNA-binding transcriptional LysR family regulator
MVQGSLSGLFDGPTTVDMDFDAPIQTVDLSRLDGRGDETVAMTLACVSSWGQAAIDTPGGPVRAVVRDELRYFVAVAEHLSFSRAAEHLNLAQQSLSQQIQALERGLGVRLFDRDTRGTRLTTGGQVFLPEAHAVLARVDTAVVVVQRADRSEVDRLNLAFLTSTANYMLPPVVRAMRERFPDLELTTYNVPIDELVAGVRAGRFDAAFTRPPSSRPVTTTRSKTPGSTSRPPTRCAACRRSSARSWRRSSSAAASSNASSTRATTTHWCSRARTPRSTAATSTASTWRWRVTTSPSR